MINKKQLGWLLIRWGASLAFKTDEDRNNFKTKINESTFLGGMSVSGGHILSKINPMCDFDTQSVINVMKTGDDAYLINYETSEKTSAYNESWKI